jgi:hypothetical protein
MSETRACSGRSMSPSRFTEQRRASAGRGSTLGTPIRPELYSDHFGRLCAEAGLWTINLHLVATRWRGSRTVHIRLHQIQLTSGSLCARRQSARLAAKHGFDPRYRSSPDEVIPKLEPLAGDFTNFPQHDGRALTLSARSNPSSSRTAPGEPGHLADTVPKLLGNRRADLSRSC